MCVCFAYLVANASFPGSSSTTGNGRFKRSSSLNILISASTDWFTGGPRRPPAVAPAACAAAARSFVDLDRASPDAAGASSADVAGFAADAVLAALWPPRFGGARPFKSSSSSSSLSKAPPPAFFVFELLPVFSSSFSIARMGLLVLLEVGLEKVADLLDAEGNADVLRAVLGAALVLRPMGSGRSSSLSLSPACGHDVYT